MTHFDDSDLRDALERGMSLEEVAETMDMTLAEARHKAGRLGLDLGPDVSDDSLEWITTSEMKNRTRLTANALKYRLDKGQGLGEYDLVRRLHPSPPHPSYKYQWALAPKGSAPATPAEDTKIAELEARLAVDAKAAARRIEEVEAEADRDIERANKKVAELRELLAERDEELERMATTLEVESGRSLARIAELEAAPVATLECTSGPDPQALHRILGGLDVLAWMAEHAERDAIRVAVTQLGELLGDQLGQ